MANPIDSVIVGTALNTLGYTANNTVEGLGLNSFGFLWPCEGIWSPGENPVTSTWVSCITAGSVELCPD